MSDITLKNKDVKIRKARQCFSCLRKFEIGTVMNYWAGKADGDFYTNYSCLTCKEIMQLDPYPDEGFPEGFVKEMLPKDFSPELYLSELKKLKLKQE